MPTHTLVAVAPGSGLEEGDVGPAQGVLVNSNSS